MRIAALTITGLLALAGSVSMADAPRPFPPAVEQLDRDIHANEVDRSTDLNVYADQRQDLYRDRLDRNADRMREDQDLAKGNLKGAAYWSKQAAYQNGRVVTEKRDLAHTRTDIRNDNARIDKDVKVRNRDLAKSRRR